MTRPPTASPDLMPEANAAFNRWAAGKEDELMFAHLRAYRVGYFEGHAAADMKWRSQVNAASRQMESAYRDIARWIEEGEAGGVDAVALAHLRALVEDNLPTT